MLLHSTNVPPPPPPVPSSSCSPYLLPPQTICYDNFYKHTHLKVVFYMVVLIVSIYESYRDVVIMVVVFSMCMYVVL